MLVFAASRAQAKYFATWSDWLVDEEWINLRATREPKIDEHAHAFGAGPLDFSTAEQVRLARDLGWHEIEAGYRACDTCGRHEWSLLPESRLDDVADGALRCRGCRHTDGASE